MPTYKPYLNQSYEKIKEDCLKSNRLFEDALFPASDKSLYCFKPPERSLIWRRPHEITDNPQFIVDSVVPNDLDQGQIGDCWLISSCAAIATIPEYLNTVIPTEGQAFDKSDYAGIFHFRLWRFGEWIDVVVDDLLPVDAETNQLIYCHNSKDTNEMFGPLLEKAFAKLNTCYEFLDGGDSIDAMIDMTGGVHETFKVRSEQQDDGMLKVEKNKLWEVVFKSFCMKSLGNASIDVGSNVQEGILENGLVLGHAYTVETAFEIFSSNNDGLFDTLRASPSQKMTSKTIKLLKMRNPWGQNKSWTGKWSSDSPEWNKIDETLKNFLQFNDQTNGQFYISFSDFYYNFDKLQFVYVNFNAFYDEKSESYLEYNWEMKQFKGAWIAGENAGGCGNEDWDYYWTNPQYAITLSSESSSDDNLVSLIVSLIQTEQVRMRAETNGSYECSNEPMSFRIYQVVEKTNKSKYTENQLKEVGNLGIYLGEKEVAKRLDLPPGDYVVIPSLFKKDVAMQFLLRLFMESPKPTTTETSRAHVNLDVAEIKTSNNVNGVIENQNDLPDLIKQQSWQEESHVIDSSQYDNQVSEPPAAMQSTVSSGCCIIL